MKLDDDSSHLCTFNTPIGRYRFTRLPFGVKCPPEIFQRTMDQIDEDMESVEVIMDVFVAGDELDNSRPTPVEVPGKSIKGRLKA